MAIAQFPLTSTPKRIVMACNAATYLTERGWTFKVHRPEQAPAFVVPEPPPGIDLGEDLNILRELQHELIGLSTAALVVGMKERDRDSNAQPG